MSSQRKRGYTAVDVIGSREITAFLDSHIGGVVIKADGRHRRAAMRGTASGEMSTSLTFNEDRNVVALGVCEKDEIAIMRRFKVCRGDQCCRLAERELCPIRFKGRRRSYQRERLDHLEVTSCLAFVWNSQAVKLDTQGSYGPQVCLSRRV